MWAKQDFLCVNTTCEIIVSGKPERKWEKTREQTEINMFICHAKKSCTRQDAGQAFYPLSANLRRCKSVLAYCVFESIL